MSRSLPHVLLLCAVLSGEAVTYAHGEQPSNPASSDEKDDPGKGGENGKGQENPGKDDSGEKDGKKDKPTDTSDPQPEKEHLDAGQSEAFDAVTEGRAMPLEDILNLADREEIGEVLDADLITVQGMLLYELRVIDANGAVSEVYYYAKSGVRVETN
jgi:uncharacterized membrane protein YkoI